MIFVRSGPCFGNLLHDVGRILACAGAGGGGGLSQAGHGGRGGDPQV